jgi:hypothetical protein
MIYIDVGRDGHVWGVDEEQKVYFRQGISESARSGTHWEEIMDSEFSEVAICTTGHVWAIDMNKDVYYRSNIVDAD